MWPTAWMLRSYGLHARTFGYPTRRGTLADQGARLHDFVDRWLGADPPPILGFVTHSMGGLVVRAWLGSGRADPAQQQRVVMLSPPNRGSQLARHSFDNRWFRRLYGDAAHELASDAPLELGPLPPCARVLVLAGGTGKRGYNSRIVGDDDGVVAVSEMGMPGVEPTFVGGLHGFLQWTPALVRRAAAFIATGEDPG
jgi:hypothetical protein